MRWFSRGWAMALCVCAPVVVHAQVASFSDQTASCGISLDRPIIPEDVEDKMGGGCVGDFNRDGFQDLFILGGAFADRLYINQGNGTFVDQATAWGVAHTHVGSGAVAVDYNNDGWTDIYVTSHGPRGAKAIGQHRLYRNMGNGTFQNVATAAGLHRTATVVPDGYGATFGDYDLDGDLDCAVTGWVANNANANRVFRNNGNGTFTNVTPTITSPAFALTTMRGMTPLFVDMNGDRYPELLWANDFTSSKYWRNNTNGTFTEITAASGTGLDGNGMGQAIGDFNRDGRPDWYVTSIYVPGGLGSSIPGTGNMLYMNNGNHVYAEAGASSGVANGGWGWGVVAVDMNNDGHEDIVSTNGWGRGSGTSLFENDPSVLFLRDPNAPLLFTEAAATSGLVHTGLGRGLASLDYDNDGDQDVAIFMTVGPFTLYRNDIVGPGCHSLRVFLDTRGRSGLPTEGVGARVVLNPQGDAQYRWITVGGSYLSSSERSAHFGLAHAPSASLRVEWPNGLTTEFPSVAANQTIRVRACEGDADGSGAVGVNDLFLFLDQWFAQAPAADADFSRVVDIDDLWRFIDAWFAGCS